jgi:dTDP-4-dehydrorhamnose reductase
VLLVGAGGQLANELEASIPAGVEVSALSEIELDITDAASTTAAVADSTPEVVINAAAYTAVDAAEEETVAASAVNVEGVAHLAAAAASRGARLVHVSTDFVFDGQARRPYRPQDDPRPLSVYGRTKLAGEVRAQEILGERATIVRTSWLYSSRGSNFVTGMLDLMAQRSALRIVDDQKGSPTWAALLARALWRVAAREDMPGIWHWADGGGCSWFVFASAIQEEAIARGLLDKAIPLSPIPTSEYPTPAQRPAYSVLETSATYRALGATPVPWRAALGRMLDEMIPTPSSTPRAAHG